MLEKQIIINTNDSETRVAVMEREHVAELFIERTHNRGLMGNIYKAKVSRVLPGMQAAFIDIGEDKAGFLYISDVVNDELIRLSQEMFATSTEDISFDEI
ncbi:MAG: hypothetical protein NT027_07315 [Proteobacteria bacterium]|nr:hypothetical protein [Pseudomonadota bacterium]